jgi:hypothetical protein
VSDAVRQGEWGTTSADQDPGVPDIDITEIRKTLATLQREFRALIRVLLTDLAFQGDTEMRFLGIRLNYNEVTTPPTFDLLRWIVRHGALFSVFWLLRLLRLLIRVGIPTCTTDGWARETREKSGECDD